MPQPDPIRPGRRLRLVVLWVALLVVCLIVPRLREWAFVVVILIVLTPFGGYLKSRLTRRR